MECLSVNIDKFPCVVVLQSVEYIFNIYDNDSDNVLWQVAKK